MAQKKTPILLYRILLLLLTALFFIMSMSLYGYSQESSPDQIFYGMEDAMAVAGNLDYNDTDNLDEGERYAIYETGALEILKGFGQKQFMPDRNLTREEALGIVYRMAGREKDAQLEAERLYNRGTINGSVPSIWARGYVQLALNEGLVNNSDVIGDSYYTEDATRQEMAFWMAKALGLEPVYGQDKIFNSFNDWSQADILKIPYIEAVLKYDIMWGSAGYFRPQGAITRMDAAVFVKNAQDIILAKLNYKKLYGTVESMDEKKDYTGGVLKEITSINIRNSGGKTHLFVFEKTLDTPVYDGRNISSSIALKQGDRIEYIVTDEEEGNNKKVRYVSVISSKTDTDYVVAVIKDIDETSLVMEVIYITDLDYPDMSLFQDGISLQNAGEKSVKYNYSEELHFSYLSPDMSVLLTIENDVVVKAEVINTGIGSKDAFIVKGIVEDNNPALGYITLFNENGTGIHPDNYHQMILLRTFSYIKGSRIEVLRNGEGASIEDIEPGDSVFIELDDNKDVVSISAAQNYNTGYGKIVFKTPLSIAVEYDNRSQELLEINEDTIITINGNAAAYELVKPGDQVRLIVNKRNINSVVKSLAVNNTNNLVSNIYKGSILKIDTMLDRILLSDLKLLAGTQWRRTEIKGVADIDILEDAIYYYKGEEISPSKAAKSLNRSNAYLAMKMTNDREMVSVISIQGADEKEIIYEDTISVAGNNINLKNSYLTMKYNPASIIVVDGRLSNLSAISGQRDATLIAGRLPAGDINTGAVIINTKKGMGALEIYRGRICEIKENLSFTLQSFSMLEETDWSYANTPKTFLLDADTHITDEDGIVNQRNFLEYGEDSYLDQTVYVAAEGLKALVVSTAPFGNYIYRGTVKDINSEDSLYIRDCVYFDDTANIWTDTEDMTVKLINSSIIIKNSSIAQFSDIIPGDSVRMIKRDDDSENLYILMVEK